MFEEVLYFLNTGVEGASLALPAHRGKAWRLHPVQASASAADARVRDQARQANGVFTIPGRSAVVFVIPKGESL